MHQGSNGSAIEINCVLFLIIIETKKGLISNIFFYIFQREKHLMSSIKMIKINIFIDRNCKNLVSTLGETLKVLYSKIAGRQNCRGVVCTFVHSESEKTFLKTNIFGCLKSLGLREISEVQVS
jgi:hypothetical protein